ncbi:nucleoside triphosphate pyrophosphohydrolase [Streptomyces sp. NPDC005576]|uniref:nucleoside triphosphate pyrophosphohydrolase n=1 Tax=Streptomyces sp. NPDC005576 TaxID=3364726 RepID=UPI0036D17F50
MSTFTTSTITKLIRDRIPEIAASRGQQLTIRYADGQEMCGLLRDKLIEEAAEVAAATPGEVLEELADVLEVVQALAEIHGYQLTDLDEARANKAAERGAFKLGVVATI